MRALVIDDSSDVRSLLCRFLKDLKIETFQAGNGKEGLALLKQLGAMDVALVDLYMPEMNGHEFVKAVRDRKEFDGMKLMMVTTEIELAHVEKALAAGANEYVMKPFSSSVIKEKLAILGLIND